MKKFLTVLLVIAVMFTFSFGSAFAAETKYNADDYREALEAEMNKQLGYLETAKSQALDTYAYDENGFDYNKYVSKNENGVVGFTEAVYAKAIDALIADLTEQMEDEIDNVIDEVFADVETVETIDVSAITEIAAGYVGTNYAEITTTIAGTKAYYTVLYEGADEAALNYYKGLVADVDVEDYSDSNEACEIDGEKVSSAVYVAYVIEIAEDAIKEAAKYDKEEGITTTVKVRVREYKAAYDTMTKALEDVKTIDEEEVQDIEDANTVEAAMAAYLSYGYNEAYAVAKVEKDDNVKNIEALEAFVDTDDKTVFGVEVKDLEDLTAAEAAAINKAYLAAVKASYDVVEVYADGEVKAVTTLYDSEEEFLQTLANAMAIADKYAEVVELGETYKAEYVYGVKVYDDEEVDAAVKAAEAEIYADLNEEKLDSAEKYLEAGAKEADVDMKAADSEYDALKAAAKAASDKFEGKIITYGANKTAEADKIYKYNYYATDDAVQDDFEDIKDEAQAALALVEAYDEIEEIMSAAEADLAELLTAANEDAVEAAIESYTDALEAYAELQAKLVDEEDYEYGQFDAILEAGTDLIEAAITVDGVEEAYEDAKALFETAKTDAEIDALKKEVEEQIDDIPVRSSLTAADYENVMDVYEEYVNYTEIPGAKALSTSDVNTLKKAVQKVAEAVAEDLEDEVEDLEEMLDDIKGESDAAIAARIALKAEIEAMVAEATAYNEAIADVNDTFTTLKLAEVDVEDLEEMLGTESAIWMAEVTSVMRQVVAAVNSGDEATMADAMAAYNALTERQQYYIVDQTSYLELIQMLEDTIGFDDVDAQAYVQDLKIVARSVKTAKGNVKVTINADVETLTANGYTVEYKFYRSEKARSNYGKAKMVTEKNTYTNTAGVKGTQYFYKAKLVVKNAAGEVVATTPLSQCKYATRIWSK